MYVGEGGSGVRGSEGVVGNDVHVGVYVGSVGDAISSAVDSAAVSRGNEGRREAEAGGGLDREVRWLGRATMGCVWDGVGN